MHLIINLICSIWVYSLLLGSLSFCQHKCSVLQNTSEDTDDMYDDLFKKYGKVVYTRNDQKSPIAEVDDDAESLACKNIYP